jgi:hypothetical protein
MDRHASRIGVPTHVLDVLSTKNESEWDSAQSAIVPPISLDYSALRRAMYDRYALLVHYATSRFQGTMLASFGSGDKTPNDSSIHLYWQIPTSLSDPIGRSAIYMGQVLTHEPIEAIAYAETHEALSPLTVTQLDIGSNEYTSHMWDWHSVSVPLSFHTEYAVKVNGTDYTVPVNTKQLLGMMYDRKHSRFMLNSMASSLASTWFTSTMHQIANVEKDIKRLAKGTQSDDYMQMSLHGAIDQFGMLIATKLRTLGSTVLGSNAQSVVINDIAIQMYDQGLSDYHTGMRVGVQRTALEVWAGLVTLEAMLLVDTPTLKRVSQWLNKNNIIGMVAARLTDIK